VGRPGGAAPGPEGGGGPALLPGHGRGRDVPGGRGSTARDHRVAVARRPQGPCLGAAPVVPLACRARHRGAHSKTSALRPPDQRPGRRQGPGV
ncbi:MAG: hypothetical protein AVDCRST_MAG02-2045, partial [uncultured Rubrobacteraceae bacterium]